MCSELLISFQVHVSRPQKTRSRQSVPDIGFISMWPPVHIVMEEILVRGLLGPKLPKGSKYHYGIYLDPQNTL